MTAGLGVSHSGMVATLTLQRPARRNAMDPELGRAFVREMRRLDADPSVRAIVVTGEGPAFCAGADLSTLAQGPQALAAFADDPELRELPLVPALIDTPVAMAVTGAAAGAGFVLAIAGDACFVDPTARFIPVFPHLGLVAEYACAWLLPRRVGSLRANDMLLTGRVVDASTAATWGLANEVCGDALARAHEWAHSAAQCAPYSVATAKAQLRTAGSQSLADAHAESLHYMAESFTRADLPEALLARAEGRSAEFAPHAPN